MIIYNEVLHFKHLLKLFFNEISIFVLNLNNSIKQLLFSSCRWARPYIYTNMNALVLKIMHTKFGQNWPILFQMLKIWIFPMTVPAPPPQFVKRIMYTKFGQNWPRIFRYVENMNFPSKHIISLSTDRLALYKFYITCPHDSKYTIG